MLGDPGAEGHSPDDPGGAVPVQPPPVPGQEERPSGALADRQVDRPGGARGEGDGDDLAALAGDDQGTVASFQAQVLDVRAGGLLARTGMRAGELAGLEADAVVLIGAAHWLRIPLGKLRNDRYVPLHPELVRLLTAWTAANLDHIRRRQRLVADHRGPLDRHGIARIVRRVARAAGVPGVHPHRLRHTLATQAINRGMRLEAIAALLGHQKMEMTLICARIANRVVADEYAAVSAKIDALYGQPELPADYESAGMARLRREAHARMLGNGLCTRPAELDCRMESACETCAYFRTGTEFLPVLIRQRDHARDHGQDDRANLFKGLIEAIDQPDA